MTDMTLTDDNFTQLLEKLGSYEAYQEAFKHTLDEPLWGKAKRENTRVAYESYLTNYPNGLFRHEATARLDDVIAEEKAEERRIADELVKQKAEEACIAKQKEDERVAEEKRQLKIKRFAKYLVTPLSTAVLIAKKLLDNFLIKRLKKYFVVMVILIITIGCIAIEKWQEREFNSLITWADLNGIGESTLPRNSDKLKKLRKIDLTKKELIDLPESIGQLANLRELVVDNNKLTSLPESISKLSNLTRLSVDSNQLTSLPESIGQLANLRELVVDNNKLTSLPESISRLSNLTELFVMSNQLTSLPESIGQLTNLTKLAVFDNQLTSLPESIGQLSNLTILFVANNQLTSLPKSIDNLQKLDEGFFDKDRYLDEQKVRE